MAQPLVKICGLTRAEDARCAADNGADFLGFIHFGPSPRHIDLDQAKSLGPSLPSGPARVGVLVDADLEAVRRFAGDLQLDYLQLHGPHSAAELAAIKDAVGLNIIKACGVSTAADVEAATAFVGAADRILFDAKPPAGSTRPGGNAVSFPWGLMQGYTGPPTWLLAGGLTPDTVARAIAESGAPGVDVASGVETQPGIKSHARIKAFIRAAKAAS